MSVSQAWLAVKRWWSRGQTTALEEPEVEEPEGDPLQLRYQCAPAGLLKEERYPWATHLRQCFPAVLEGTFEVYLDPASLCKEQDGSDTDKEVCSALVDTLIWKHLEVRQNEIRWQLPDSAKGRTWVELAAMDEPHHVLVTGRQAAEDLGPGSPAAGGELAEHGPPDSAPGSRSPVRSLATPDEESAVPPACGAPEPYPLPATGRSARSLDPRESFLDALNAAAALDAAEAPAGRTPSGDAQSDSESPPGLEADGPAEFDFSALGGLEGVEDVFSTWGHQEDGPEEMFESRPAAGASQPSPSTRLSDRPWTRKQLQGMRKRIWPDTIMEDVLSVERLMAAVPGCTVEQAQRAVREVETSSPEEQAAALGAHLKSVSQDLQELGQSLAENRELIKEVTCIISQAFTKVFPNLEGEVDEMSAFKKGPSPRESTLDSDWYLSLLPEAGPHDLPHEERVQKWEAHYYANADAEPVSTEPDSCDLPLRERIRRWQAPNLNSS